MKAWQRHAVLLLPVVLMIPGGAFANMLTNPGFEQGPSGWAFSGNVGCEFWARRTGTNGCAFRAWLASPATLSQTVSAGTGTYTFAVWLLREPNHQAQTNLLRIRWLTAGGIDIQEPTVKQFSLPPDDQWHLVYVTGTGTSAAMAQIEVAVIGAWAVGSGPCSFFIDDAALYAGTYQGSRYLANPGFESGSGSWKNNGWFGAPDLWGWGQGGRLGETWANHSGTGGVGFYSWDSTSSRFAVVFGQNVNPVAGTGTYTYSLWLKRETYCLFSNPVLTIQWYDTTFTNKVQPDVSTNLGVIPNDNQWRQYSLSAVCTSPLLYEARILFSSEWFYVSTNDPRSAMVDDFSFHHESEAWSVYRDWNYHAALGGAAFCELVPETNVGAFVQVNRAQSNVTFYILARNPSAARYYPDENGVWELRTAWWDPNTDSWSQRWEKFTRVGSLTLTTNAPFHGQPTNGSQTVDLWKHIWQMPTLVLTGYPARVYYAPFFKSTNAAGQQTDWLYLLRGGSGTTPNNFGQRVGQDYVGVDYILDFNQPVYAALTNGGFEWPATNTDMATSGWLYWGDVGRDYWAARGGDRGGRFGSWNAGHFAVWQNIACTGGTHTLALWLQYEPSANPYAAELRIEWYTTNGVALQRDVRDLTRHPRDRIWHPVYVTGTCLSNNVGYARVILEGIFDAPTGTFAAVKFDDVRFYPGPFQGTSFTNSSFEHGHVEGGNATWAGVGWSVVPEDHTWRADWARHWGGTGVALEGWSPFTNHSFILTQPVAAGTGTYTLVAWLAREQNFLWHEAELRLEWYDVTLTNKVQADTVTNFTLPNDGQFYEYRVTGTCTDTNLYEIRPVLYARWSGQTGLYNCAGKVDDVRLSRGSYTGTYLDPEWAYHAGKGYYAIAEQVPGGGYGAFLQANYVTRTNTFYVLTKHPTFALNPGEYGSVGLRTSWQDPSGSWSNDTYAMTHVGTLVIPASAPFHGLPAAGAVTVDLWRTQAPQPRNSSGQPFTTNTIPFFYSPYLQVTSEVELVDLRYLIFNDGSVTNELGQILGGDYMSKDYLYWNRVPAPNASLLNADCEGREPSWIMAGGGYESWANHQGTSGVGFWSWDPGNSVVYQDVDTTGGLYCFSAWLKIQPGATPIDLRMRMEWYATNGLVVQVNEKDLTRHTKENFWTKVAVVGQCTQPGLDFVRLAFYARYADGTNEYNEGIQIDDFEFSPIGPDLVNAGFETGNGTNDNGGSMGGWHGYLVSQRGWAAMSGTNGVAVQGWEEIHPSYDAYLAQYLACGAGTYQFKIWIKREADCALTNAELRLEWYDATWTNKVQADTVTYLSIPADNAWREYSIVGSCASPNLAGVRPVVWLQIDRNIGGVSRAMMLDDATFQATGSVEDSDGDGMPDWWELQYFGNLTTAGPGTDSDLDGFKDLEEWWADTHPMHDLSFFPNVVTSHTGYAVVTLQAGPPTTNSRRYDVWWNTNLLEGSWVPFNLNIVGRSDGGAVNLVVTNDVPRRFYRTGVKVPP